MSEVPLEINRENRSVFWTTANHGEKTWFELYLKSERGSEFVIATDSLEPILKLYNLAVKLYLNGETVPRQRIWGEAMLRSEVRALDKMAARNTGSEVVCA